ncbi:MAG: CDP-alcohol phosphatidyltransferase family protein [Planctomycetota bacterium]
MTSESMNTSEQPTSTADCYSDGERAAMEWGQRVRARTLAPLLRLLSRLSVSADLITGLSLLIGLAAIALLAVGCQWTAVVCLALHVLLDGLDGPLARMQGTASPRGSFTDTMADQIVVTGVAIWWIATNPQAWPIVIGCSFVFLYTLVVAIAMVRNALEVPYTWLVRPRFFFFAALVIDAIFFFQSAIIVLSISNLLLAMKAGSGFLALRSNLPGPISNDSA